MDEAKLRVILEGFVKELTALLGEVKVEPESKPEDAEEGVVRLGAFFDQVRPLFGGKLTIKQVGGMEAKIEAFMDADLPLSHAAYSMATSYHETAKRMQPVREGLSVSDAWRKRNLRYYPWYGRGDVQLTWKENYAKADKELGLGGALIDNLDLALDPDVSAAIMVRGMEEGWFSGDAKGRHTLIRHLPHEEGTLAEFTQARRIINLMDKADLIAGYAIKFQTALKKTGY